MEKHTIRIAALTLLSVHLLCSATIAQCQTIAAGVDNGDINEIICCRKKCNFFNCCACCIYTDWCYSSFERCNRNCLVTFSHSDEMLAATKVTPETVLTRSAVRTDSLMRGVIPEEFGDCHV
ncbi:hypothetical protein CFC21_027084 [Triticum aestivum]|uniref:Acidic protein n=4 Tax=Triticinae TaxID=1648030 RepID=A0A453A8B5_AEGTS|nr:uncharacterized protein LOC109746165 [Aegilops tauschii subsp. strangulata]XP_044327255.1 uncharacterized protein LOC123048168 [Triticum aestivum]KAF7012942.1 hypothetical protein CFC21_027084 [Triticum aestivum]